MEPHMDQEMEQYEQEELKEFVYNKEGFKTIFIFLQQVLYVNRLAMKFILSSDL